MGRARRRGDAGQLRNPPAERRLTTHRRRRRLGGIPTLRAGVACGGAFRHAGDWYGRPINLASRITGVAPSRSLIATQEVCEASGEGFRCERWKQMTLKGIEGPVSLYRIAASA